MFQFNQEDDDDQGIMANADLEPDHWYQRKDLRSIAAVLSAGVLVSILLWVFAAEPPKVEVPKVAASVIVETVSPQSARTKIKGFGTVAPQSELSIRPQVSGTVVAINEDFQVGGRIPKGETLFQIDPRDYEIALEEQRAALERARFELKLEQGNQIVAQREWKLLKQDGRSSPLSEELALRRPHLREKEAAVRAAESRLRKAELDLERATKTTPFNAVVIEEDLEIGKFVSSQELIGRIVSTDQFDVEVQVLRSDLRWLPEIFGASVANEDRPSATIIHRLESGKTYRREGEVVRLLGNVDQGGRMARILVRIKDPLAVSADSEVPLLLGSYVEVQVDGSEIEGVYKLPRKAIREGKTVWTVEDDNTLSIHQVTEVFSTAEHTFVRGELGNEARVITNPITGALQGMPVAIIQ